MTSPERLKNESQVSPNHSMAIWRGVWPVVRRATLWARKRQATACHGVCLAPHLDWHPQRCHALSLIPSTDPLVVRRDRESLKGDLDIPNRSFGYDRHGHQGGLELVAHTVLAGLLQPTDRRGGVDVVGLGTVLVFSVVALTFVLEESEARHVVGIFGRGGGVGARQIQEDAEAHVRVVGRSDPLDLQS